MMIFMVFSLRRPMALGNVDFSDPLEGIQYSPPSNNLNHKVQNILIPKRDSVSSIAKRPKGKCQWEMIPYLAVYTTYICTTYSPCLLLGYMLRTYLPTYLPPFIGVPQKQPLIPMDSISLPQTITESRLANRGLRRKNSYVTWSKPWCLLHIWDVCRTFFKRRSIFGELLFS